MGSHSWCDICPACGYTGMQAADTNGDYSSDCPICGYRTWTAREEPTEEQVGLAKQIVAKLSEDEMTEALETYFDSDYIPLVKVEAITSKVH